MGVFKWIFMKRKENQERRCKRKLGFLLCKWYTSNHSKVNRVETIQDGGYVQRAIYGDTTGILITVLGEKLLRSIHYQNCWSPVFVLPRTDLSRSSFEYLFLCPRSS